MMFRGAAVIVCAIAALSSGCASTPPARFYTLSATVPPATTASRLSVSVGPVSVPPVADRPQFVLSTGANEVRLDDFNRWAAPLQDSLARVIADDLAALLGTSSVTLFPQTSSADADYRVAIEVRRFESTPGESSALDAVWILRRTKDGKTETRRTTVREPVTDGSHNALVSAHNRALARLSQEIAQAICPSTCS